MRKKRAEVRDVLPDPVYNSKIVTKLVNQIMTRGKKGTAQKILYDAFKVIEKRRLFSTKDDANLKEIPGFWACSKADGTIGTLCGYCGGSEFDGQVLGICYGDGCSANFLYSIASGYNGKTPVPGGFRINEISARTWAIFKCKGAMPDAIQDLWR